MVVVPLDSALASMPLVPKVSVLDPSESTYPGVPKFSPSAPRFEPRPTNPAVPANTAVSVVPVVSDHATALEPFHQFVPDVFQVPDPPKVLVPADVQERDAAYAADGIEMADAVAIAASARVRPTPRVGIRG